MRRRILYKLFPMLMFSACATRGPNTGGTFVVFEGSTPRLNEDQVLANALKVKVVMDKAAPGKVHEIGFIEATAKGANVPIPDLMAELRIQAAKCGADGVHKVRVHSYSHDGPALHAIGTGFVFKK